VFGLDTAIAIHDDVEAAVAQATFEGKGPKHAIAIAQAKMDARSKEGVLTAAPHPFALAKAVYKAWSKAQRDWEGWD